MNNAPARPVGLSSLHAYDKHVVYLAFALDDGQVEVMLGQMADRWRQPDEPLPGAEPLPPRELLIAKLTLERLMRGTEAALADLDQLVDRCFGAGPGAYDGAPGFAANPFAGGLTA